MVLDWAVYGFNQVDRLLGLSAGTAERWIDGYERGGQCYAPVIRRRPTGDEAVTWGEFVEVQFLARYRDQGVPLRHMRPVVEGLRDELGVEYPLAWEKPLASQRELVMDVQEACDVPRPLWLVYRTKQLVLTPPAASFYEQVDWHDSGFALRLHPCGRSSPVVYDPLVGFGEPVVGSVRTEVIAEELRAGDSPQSVASGFGLDLDFVLAAAKFEGVATAA
jgi:uncharacterized protein (DUF433 family)